MALTIERLRLAAVKMRRTRISNRPAPSETGAPVRALEDYRFDPIAYLVDFLGWTPWRGDDSGPGQVEIIEAYVLALRQQFERDAYQLGTLAEADLVYWKPGQPIFNHIKIEAGHTVGKTMLAAGLVNHFYDCFVPSIGYTFAPGWKQIHDLLWKEIKAGRRGKGLPGRILDLVLKKNDDHFVTGSNTDNAGGTGSERTQGQHGPHMIFALDEAEAIPEFVFKSLDSMTSGGISIVLYLGNPRTRLSNFYRVSQRPDTITFRISCLNHPNVTSGRPLIPDAVRREYVDGMINSECERVEEDDPENYTFRVGWDVPYRGGVAPAGTWFRPSAEMLWRVLGIPPANISDNTLITVGRYESATKRQPLEQAPKAARIGVDVARFGRDFGTIYIRWNGRVWRHARLEQLDTTAYARTLKEACRDLRKRGVDQIHIRVDGGGGFGGGVIDQLSNDLDFVREMTTGAGELEVWEVHFNGVPYDHRSYADLITELYADAAEGLKRLAIIDPPPLLSVDLTERTYKWWNWQGYDVKRLEAKVLFRERLMKEGRGNHSPDDGDGFVLAVGSDFIFETQREAIGSVEDLAVDVPRISGVGY